MIEARHASWAHFLFRTYLAVAFRRSFHAVRLLGEPPIVPDSQQIVLAANHASWWDGFYCYLLNDRFFHRRCYLMMIERELSRFRFFSRVGCFSVRHGSASSARKAFAYMSRILDEAARNIVFFFPQGELLPDVDASLCLPSGLRLLSTSAPTVVVPTYFRLEHLSHAMPTAFLSFGEPLQLDEYQSDPAILERSIRSLRDNVHARILAGDRGRVILGKREAGESPAGFQR